MKLPCVTFELVCLFTTACTCVLGWEVYRLAMHV